MENKKKEVMSLSWGGFQSLLTLKGREMSYEETYCSGSVGIVGVARAASGLASELWERGRKFIYRGYVDRDYNDRVCFRALGGWPGLWL